MSRQDHIRHTYYNIEKSRFTTGVYEGWDNEGNRYRIVKNGRGPWWVYPQDKGPTFYAGTLALVSLRLETTSSK